MENKKIARICVVAIPSIGIGISVFTVLYGAIVMKSYMAMMIIFVMLIVGSIELYSWSKKQLTK